MLQDDVIAKDRLDPARIVDLDLTGDVLRQGALRGMCAEWAKNPPFYVINFGVPQAVVGRYADVREVYMDRDRFTATPPKIVGYERFDFFNGITSVAQMDGSEHDRVRLALMPSFSPAVLSKLDRRIRDIVEAMLDEVEARGGPFDCINDFAVNLIVRVLLDGVLGMSADQQQAFVRMHESLALMVDVAPGEAAPAAYVEAEQAVFRVMAEMVDERRAQPREHDFVSAMVAKRDASETLSDEEVVANIFGICAAGQGTTAVTTTALLMNLCKHRDQFDEVIADPGLIPQTVEESLRYQGSGIFSFPRFATEDCEIGGVPILKGMPVHIAQQAANLDPEVYPDPLKFDIHRNPKGMLAFGTGSHHCVGNRMARQIICIVLERVCVRFPNLRLQDLDLTPRYEGMFGELKPVSVPMHTGLA